MDFIIGWRRYETTFKGASVTMELRPLKSDAMFAMSPHFGGERRKPGESIPEFVARLTDEQKERLRKNSQALQRLSVSIFPEHVRNLSGFTVNGLPPTWETLANESVFMDLAVEICGQLASISSLPEASEKNSKPPSGSHRPGEAATCSFSDSPPASG